MGKVFSWGEIERKEIPQPSDFSAVVSKTRQNLEVTNGVVGGILCGSVLWNSYNERSDIDCLVVYDPAKRREVVKALRDINQTAATLHVPVELIPLDLDVVRTPMHYIGPSFADHLRYAAENGGVIKKNPLPLFVSDSISVVENLRGYFRNKLRRLEKGVSTLPTMEGAELLRFLQKVLEAPTHIARKLLRWQGVEMSDDSKRTVTFHYPDIANAREYELFVKITTIDSQYTAEILTQLQHPNQDQYSRVIGEIEELAWDTLEFVRLNALRLI